MNILATFLEAVKKTVMICFKKTGVTSEAQCTAITDSDNQFKDLQKSWNLDVLKAADPDMVPVGLSSENVIYVNHGVIATVPCITEDETLDQFQTQQAESDKGGNDCDHAAANDVASERSSRLTVEPLVSTWGTQKCCLVQPNRWRNAVFVLRFENLFSKERLVASKQTNMTEFFCKVG